MTNEEILENAIFFSGKRSGRINICATTRKMQLNNYQGSQFRTWLKVNHPDLIAPLKMSSPMDTIFYCAGIFSITCIPTGRRLIGTTKSSFQIARNLHLSYARKIDTYHKMNPWLRDQQSIDDIKTHGVDSLQFEILEITPPGTTTLQMRVKREEWLARYSQCDAQKLYSRNIAHSKNIKYEEYTDEKYPENIRTMANDILELIEFKQQYEKSFAAAIIERQRVQQEFDMATDRKIRQNLRAVIVESIAEKKDVSQKLQQCQTKLTRLTKLLNYTIEHIELQNLRVAGRPKL